MEQPTVLIISDDPEFSRAIPGRWQSERTVPSFIQMNSDVSLAFDPENFQLAIVGQVKPEALTEVLGVLDATGKRILFVAEDAGTQRTVRERWPGMLILPQRENWLEMAVLLATEALARVSAEAQAEDSERSRSALDRQATLGRFMLDMRHTMNNALTSVLGNSELILLEPGSLSAEGLAQMETIRNMALRIHEIMQRFSSLEKELNVVERQSRKPAGASAQAAAM